jgi:hypothetical protein
MTRWLLSPKTLFSLFLVAWFAYGVWEARSYAYLAKIFPFYVSLVLLFFAVLSIIIDITKAFGRSEDLQEASGGGDLAVDWDIPMSAVWRRFGFFLGIIIGVYVFIYLIGYPLTMSLFICFFYRLIAKATWRASLVAGGLGLGFLALASSVMGMDWPEGLLKLPWPLG